jgi:hypothetical protein
MAEKKGTKKTAGVGCGRVLEVPPERAPDETTRQANHYCCGLGGTAPDSLHLRPPEPPSRNGLLTQF